MTPRQALSFVRRHGIVLESARGPLPSLAEAIAGAPIKGSWWRHPMGEEIFKITRWVRDSRDIFVCRLVDGKITFVHRRLWPALVRLADELPSGRLAHIRERHTARGRHAIEALPYPRWVPGEVLAKSKRLSCGGATAALGTWFQQSEWRLTRE